MRRMKIEPFPWLRDNLIDMNKFYTELNFAKVENIVLGKNTTHIKKYEEMLQCNSDSDWETEEKCSESLETNAEDGTLDRKKILLKADARMGKSTLGKKIGFDCSRGIFKINSVVFFVTLKLVKPGEAIENVIIQQHPELEGLNVSPRKVRSMLERLDDRCLLILDGLDEHGLGKNEDVLKMIEN